MAQHALGNVTPSSTTVGLRATNNIVAKGLNDAIDKTYSVQALQFQALSTNTSSVFICDKETPNLALDVLVEIPAPGTTPATRPAWTIGDPSKAAAFDARTFWVVPVVANEGVRVTVVR